jgi:hypothetical protein
MDTGFHGSLIISLIFLLIFTVAEMLSRKFARLHKHGLKNKSRSQPLKRSFRNRQFVKFSA